MKKLVLAGIAVAALALSSTFAQAEMIQVKGSDTIINLVQKLAEEYMKTNPSVKISVTGGGSGTGIAALINKKCSIANASRAISAKEIEMAAANGVTPSRVVIAIDGLSVITNSGNMVSKLTMDQIGGIFRGDIKNWSEVGGSNMPITLYGRQSNSGTFGFFRELVLKGEYSSSMKAMNGNSQIVEAVKVDPSGIGYVGVGYAKQASGITVLDVAAKDGMPYASPLDSAAVEKGLYPVARPLYQYLSGNPKGAVKDFMSFELSPAGQMIVEEESFYPIAKEYADANAKFGL